jgi:hypothetical protein
MRILQEKAIRPVLDQVSDMPGQVGDVGASVARPAGHDVGVHQEGGRACCGTGNTERLECLEGIPFAFYRKAGDFEFERFTGIDEIDAGLKARAWAATKGLVFDGQLSERGLAVAMSV